MKGPRVELICIGTELLLGKVSEHGAFFGMALEKAGLALQREITVGDDPEEMEGVFREAWARGGVVICTGGLGPTFDDITRDVWARILRRPLRFDPGLLRGIAEKFKSRRYRMSPENRRQAEVIPGAEVLDNPHGTAPGQLFVSEKKVLALLPGPRQEMVPMVENHLLPFLSRLFPGNFRKTLVLRIWGRPESAIDHDLRPLLAREKGGGGVEVTWGILAQKFMTDVKVTVASGDRDKALARLERLEKKIRRRFGNEIFGSGAQTLEEIVGDLLRRRGESLSVAESCTGGLLAGKVTAVPGSSNYFNQSVVCYSDLSKMRLLGVRRKTLEKFGAVSPRTAREMAEGCRRRSGASWAISVTGIAGPDGGTLEKPVGLVYTALSGKNWRTTVAEKIFFGSRETIRQRTVPFSLEPAPLGLDGENLSPRYFRRRRREERRQPFGQNYLVSQEVAARIVGSLQAGDADNVLEIGPGKGILTGLMLGRVARLIGVEIDDRLSENLNSRWGQRPGFELIHEDFLKWTLPDWPRGSCKVIGNLPYSAANPILRKLLDWPAWSRAVVMVQKEVAERITASPGRSDFGILSLAVQGKALAQKLFDVAPGSFRPAPRVISTVLSLEPLPRPLIEDEERFFRVVHAAFGQRRKMILNALAGGLPLEKPLISSLLQESGIDPTRRPETLGLEAFNRLTRALSQHLE